MCLKFQLVADSVSEMQLPRLSMPLLVLCLASGLAIDFCQLDECEGRPHLGCKNNLTFHASCLPSNRFVNMQIYKEYLLKIHNKYREEVASGTIYGISMASGMPELAWHSKLALLAQYHAKRCLKEISRYCVALPNITHPAVNYGESRFHISKYHTSLISEHMTTLAENWLHKVYMVAKDDRGVVSPEVRNILNDRNYYMGCAASEDFDARSSHFVLICYFNEYIDRKQRVYQMGRFSSKNCKFGGSEDYPHLCKTNLYTED